MKKYTNTLITVIFLIGTLIFTFQFVKRIDRVEIIEMTDSSHIFGYITNTKIKPHKLIELPLIQLPDGSFNYPGDPSRIKFNKWILAASRDTSLLTIEEYNTRFIK